MKPYHTTSYWHPLDGERVQCDVCPRFCKLREGQHGLCFVRANHGGKVVLTSYGRSSGYCVDPVEKKPLNHFLPGTPVLSFGTAGCNLACKFCQNWDISKSRETDTLADEAPPDKIALAATEFGCKSVAYTYNDPIVFMEYAMDTAKACRERGIRSVAVSNGYICPAARRDLFAHMDAANIDLKAFTDRFYWRVTGSRLAPVLDTLQYIKHETDVWLELTTLLIPGENDTDAELRAMAAWVVENLGPDVPMHFTAFRPEWKMMDRPPTPPATLTSARDIAIEAGVRYAYTGNVHDPDGQSTYCHSCQAILIGRQGYTITDWALDEHGRCRKCLTPCAGVFETSPGTWGPRALPVNMRSFTASEDRAQI